MSYDLMVMPRVFASTPDEASEHTCLCDEPGAQADSEYDEKLRAFCAALAARYSQLSDLEDDEVDNSPWASDFMPQYAMVHLAMRWSVEQPVLDFIHNTAARHDLTVYNPQQHECVLADGTRVRSPDSPTTSDPERRRSVLAYLRRLMRRGDA